jgi:heat-inducible transcriptional repressor
VSEYQLNERERTVLAVLIEHFIKTAAPVGSRTIATRYNLGVSPATVRNTLADLEERGLIEQPHTSAGRIPTDAGYRLYVDRLLKSEKLSKIDREQIRRQLRADFSAIENILAQTSRVLASVSSQLGVTLSPKFEQGVLTRIDVIPVSSNKLLVIIMVRSGIVRTMLLELDRPEPTTDLAETVSILNEKLCGLTLAEIRMTIRERLGDVSIGDSQIIKLFMENQESVLDDVDDASLHTDGTINIVSQKEFQDPRKLREFITLLEERRRLINLLNREPESDGIQVVIGNEANLEGIDGCAVVTRTYSAGNVKGKVGIIGPTRMKYSKLLPVVEYTASILTEILSK